MRLRLTPTSHPVTYAILERIIQPISDWCSAERGRKTQFCKAMQAKALPEVMSRNLVESWISPEPENRKQPLMGNGILLITVAKDLKILPADFQLTPEPAPKPTEPKPKNKKRK